MALPIRNEAIIKAEKKELYVPKNEADVQRLKIQKLMNNPDKPVFIPDRPKAKKLKAAPEFVRDVMGSSAGVVMDISDVSGTERENLLLKGNSWVVA